MNYDNDDQKDASNVINTRNDLLSKSSLSPQFTNFQNFLRGNSILFYDMTQEGLAIVFNHHKYYKKFSSISQRKGTEFDADRLKSCLEKINFNVVIHNDLTVSEIKKVLEKVRCINRQEISCLIIVVLTHGESGYLYAADEKYETNLLWENLTALECPQLAGVPKLYFIQACRGDKVDSGYSMSDSILIPSPSRVSHKIPSMADFLHMYSTYEDHTSWRRADGSWFIQSLCEVLEEEASHWDLMQLLTFVNRKVAIEYETYSSDPTINGMKQIPQIKSMLTKLLKFKVIDK